VKASVNFLIFSYPPKIVFVSLSLRFIFTVEAEIALKNAEKAENASTASMIPMTDVHKRIMNVSDAEIASPARYRGIFTSYRINR
jgi:hypothetical protein